MTCCPMTAEDYDRMCGDDYSRRGDYFTGHGELWPYPASSHWWSRTIFEFTNDAVDPLTWHADGLQARPDRHIVETDLGSIPRVVQLIPALSSTRFARSYILHDSAYRFGGWYVRQSDGRFAFVPLSRAEADEWLYRMIRAEGGTDATASTVWAAVRACGWASWDVVGQARERARAGITVAV